MTIYKITGWPSAIHSWLCVFGRTYPPPQRVHSYEYDLVKDPLRPIIAFEQTKPQLFILNFFESGQTRQEGFVGEEACCEDEYRDGYQNIRKAERDALRRRHCYRCTIL